MTNLLELSKILCSQGTIVLVTFDKNNENMTRKEFLNSSSFSSYTNRGSLQKYHEKLTIVSMTYMSNGSIIIGTKEP